MASLFPPAWMENTQKNETGRYALIEIGALTSLARSALIDSAAPAYWPLIRNTQQAHLIREGPWLVQLAPANLPVWQTIDALPCALQAWIESPLDGAMLAEQLAPAMIVEATDRRLWLLRFYTSQAIQALHAETSADWHAALFSGITHWWYRNDMHEWQALVGLPASDPPRRDWQLSLDDALWKTLAGDPEVTALTAQLVSDMPTIFAGICAGERPRRVASALAGANNAGLTDPSDRRIYIYLWLTQGEAALREASMAKAITRAARGESSLAEQLQAMEMT